MEYVPKIFDPKKVDQVMDISQEEAEETCRQLAKQEGIFVGTSAGATFTAALQVAKEAEKGSVILAMLPDTGERYLSTPLFGDILPDMNEEEKAIFMSVPELANYTPPPPPK